MAISAHSRFTTHNLKTLIQNHRKSLIFHSFSYLLCSIFCLAFLSSCTNKEGGSEVEEDTQEVVPAEMDVQVKTAKIETGEMPIIVKAVGVLMPAMQSPANVVSMTGGIVSKVEVTEGQIVKAGTILIRLDSRKADNAVVKANISLRLVETDLQKATEGGLDIEQSDFDLEAKDSEAAAQQAKLDADRQKSLLAEHLTSEKAVLDSEKTLEEADRRAKAAKEKADLFRRSGRQIELAQLQTAVEQTRAELDAAKLDRDMLDIRAPVTGRISGLNVNVGSAVDEQTILAHVICEQNALVRSWLSPVDTEDIELGASVTIQPVSADGLISGKVTSIGSELDPDTGLVPVETKLDPNQSGLSRIGETVFLEITTKLKAKGFIVPASSIVIEDDKASIFTVDSNQIAHAIPIEILTRNTEKAVVSSEGLKNADTVIIDGNYNLPDGAHVINQPQQSTGSTEEHSE
jgi:multidrug efflux pump subunit AcrA (membrane-fusion protein)